LFFAADGERVARADEHPWTRPVQRKLIEAWRTPSSATPTSLTTLDQAIGDGDHGLNMKRGAAAILERLDDLAAMPLPMR
jgi:dihydroxyacetone kinase-like protein